MTAFLVGVALLTLVAAGVVLAAGTRHLRPTIAATTSSVGTPSRAGNGATDRSEPGPSSALVGSVGGLGNVVSGGHPAEGWETPDSTPLAAAAGTEPGSMAPVDLAAGWTSSVHRFTASGIVRSYLLVRPVKQSATPLPVLIVLHGRNLTPAGMERLAGLWRVAGPSIQVYPAGYGRSWDAGGCCGEAYEAHVDDVGFLTSVVHSVLSSNRDADPDRVYAAGFSNGGRMAFRLACQEPGLFAGIVAVEAVPVDQCSSTKPLPVLVVANRYDPLLTIGPQGRPKEIYDSVEPTVAAEVDRWRTLDGCDAGDLSAVEGRLRVVTYDDCTGTGRVTFAEYSYGGHDWSLGGPGTPSASALTWAFLDGGDLDTLDPSVTPTALTVPAPGAPATTTSASTASATTASATSASATTVPVTTSTATAPAGGRSATTPAPATSPARSPGALAGGRPASPPTT